MGEKHTHATVVTACGGLARFNELGEEEIGRRPVLHLEKFKEKEGREMTDQEFRAFVHRWQHGFVTLDPKGNEILSSRNTAHTIIAQDGTEAVSKIVVL